MNRVKEFTNEGKVVDVGFRCPGCGDWHSVAIGGAKNSSGATWGFNGNLEKPTFTPSLLVKCGHYVDGKHPCWCDYKKEHPEKDVPTCYVCHSFITDGRIQFLSDCTHPLSGQTVELPIVE